MNWLNTIIGFVEDVIWDIKFKLWELSDKIKFKKEDSDIEFDEIEVKPKKKKSNKKSKKKA